MKKRNTIIILILSVLSIMFCICLIYIKSIKDELETHTIIGRADGPTTILIANDNYYYPLIIVSICAIATIVLIVIFRKKKD